MRVLHVAQSSEYGLGRYIADLIEEQTAVGWEVSMAGDPASEIRDRVLKAGAAWLPWLATRQPGPSILSETRRLSALIKGLRPDVVHLHSSKAGVAGRLALRGKVPTIFQPHAWSFFAVDGVRRPITVGWERFGARWAHAIVCVSDDERRQGEAAGVRGKWRVVISGVDTDVFTPAPREEGPPTAVCLGRIAVAQKGQDVLLAAWRLVDVPGAQLVFVGDGPDRAALEAEAPASVRFVGHQDDVVRWYQQSDVVVQPSRYEGLSLTVLEALSCGKPVVAGDAVGMREVIGDAGAVVPVGDAAALAAAVAERLKNPKRAAKEGEAARNRVEGSFSRRRWAQEMVGLTAEVAGVRQAPSS